VKDESAMVFALTGKDLKVFKPYYKHPNLLRELGHKPVLPKNPKN